MIDAIHGLAKTSASAQQAGDVVRCRQAVFPGGIAKRLCSGLQSRLDGFDSRSRLQIQRDSPRLRGLFFFVRPAWAHSCGCKSRRKLTDRLIQQALLQVLQPILDPTFSEHSYGFRPGRRAHDAVLAAQSYVQSGLRIVVDVDLSKFFDRVNHDILIDRLRKRIDDAGVIRLVRAYLNSGIMDDGVVHARDSLHAFLVRTGYRFTAPIRLNGLMPRSNGVLTSWGSSPTRAPSSDWSAL